MYRYDNYTDSFVRIDGEPNTGSTTVRVGVPLKEAVIVEKVELTDECIDKIAGAVVRRLADRKTEPTISKMEQVETMSCQECKHYNGNDGCDVMTSNKAKCNYEPIETEPQTYITEDRDTQVLDAWQVHHRNTTSAVEDEPQTDDFFRNPTAEERKAVADYIDSISVPTGVNVFDLIDEPQMERGE